MTKHKNHEMAIAWLNGAEVEYKNHTLDGAYDSWALVDTLRRFEYDEYSFRLKPEKVKTVGYKRYVWIDYTGERRVSCVHEGQKSYHTVYQWIDTDWQYEEVEQDV